ncbi:MAG: hypothetical protein KGS72_19055 [Cyanobacteria bacterium REEB67]|nr:hypothetical protein [Cyanobacteria bacterium REEB67]
MKKRLLTAALLASTLGLGLLTSASMANPIMMGPVTAPTTKVGMTANVSTASMQAAALNTYRQVRAFWLSRALVR